MFFSSVKEMNPLLGKGMSNIYLKITVGKKRCSQNFDFPFKKFVSTSVFGELQLIQILNFETFCYNLKIRGLGAKACVVLYYLNLEKNYDVLKSKSSYFLSNKNINFNKNET